jgi:predicted amidophosphoribosyltransferase
LQACKIIFPAWYPLALVSLPLLIYLLAQAIKTPRRIIHRHRSKNGLCLQCGYDLRESKDRCPECGVPLLKPDRPQYKECK